MVKRERIKKENGYKALKISGVGIHSGQVSNMDIVAAGKQNGILFMRNGSKVMVSYKNVTNTSLRNTTIGRGAEQVKTIEHLMAALFVNGIQNARIDIDNAEIPILDGSALELINVLKNIKPTGKNLYLRVRREIVVYESEIKLPLWLRALKLVRGCSKRDGFVKLSPIKGNALKLTSEIRYPNITVIGTQKTAFTFDYDNWNKSRAAFINDIAKSRTFGTMAEYEFLKRQGMARGANEHNVIAINETGDGTLNDLFYSDEFVRHKIIDAVGDLFTSGYFIIGEYDSFKGGHALNNLVLRKLFSDTANYDIIEK